LDNIRINEKTLLKKLIEKVPFVSDDIQAHIYEHSLEVQLPFIYKLNPQATIVPLTLKILSLKECLILAQGIASATEELELSNNTIIIASTDMSHYLPDDMARRLILLQLKNQKV